MTRNKRILRYVFPGLLIVAGAMTLLCLVSLLSGNEPAGEAQRLLDRFQSIPSAGAKDDAPDPREAYLAGRNVFTGPKKPWSAQLVGVLGELAFFQGGGGLKVGENYNGAKITKIGPDFVELEVDGKTQTVYVFAGGSGSPGGPPSGGSPMRPGMTPTGPPPNFQLTPQMIEQFRSLPPDVRAKAMQNMPPNLREQLMKAM